MLTSALSWLVGSKAGRITALVLLSILIVATVLLRAFQAGQKSEQLLQAEASLKTLRDRVATEEAVRSMSREERKREHLKWAR